MNNFLAPKEDTYEPSWFEQYWWIIVIAVVAVALITFLTVFFVKRSHRMVLVTMYSDDERKTVSVRNGSHYDPGIPRKEGCRFRGWYMDSAHTIPWLTTYKVKSGICLYADWERS